MVDVPYVGVVLGLEILNIRDSLGLMVLLDTESVLRRHTKIDFVNPVRSLVVSSHDCAADEVLADRISDVSSSALF